MNARPHTLEHNDEFLLSQYLDGQLPPRQVKALERRLEAEPDLREQLRLYASLEGRLGELAQRLPAGADLAGQRSDIMASLERKVLLDGRGTDRQARRIPLWPALAAAAGLVILATVAYRYVSRLPARNPVVAEASVVQPNTPSDAPEQLALEVRRLGWEEIPLAAVEQTPPGPAVPSGTVMVSIGSAESDASSSDAVPFAIH
jgi:anti-sigma factor RsiW